jgi:preprotein translocase subunit SecG
MFIFTIIISILLILFFILLLPKNSGMGSLSGSSDQKNTLPFTFSQKLYFVLGIIFLLINYFYTY